MRAIMPQEKSKSIEKPRRISRNWADAIRRVKDFGPGGWDKGRGRAGGAVSRMFDRMKEAGFVTGPPYAPSVEGLAALAAFDKKHGG
jgi:hypothetical protein